VLPIAVRPVGGQARRDLAERRPEISQFRVLRQIALGRTGPEVADELGISPETVKRQLAITRSKLGASTTAQAVGIAVALDLI
jgi:DNA-binding CsgD family transcriptional regulator